MFPIIGMASEVGSLVEHFKNRILHREGQIRHEGERDELARPEALARYLGV